MANLYTHMIKAMKESRDMSKHYQSIVKKLALILVNVDDLLEDPLFIDNIHGEQDLSLDQTVDLFTAIKTQFTPLNPEPTISPIHEAGDIDVS